MRACPGTRRPPSRRWLRRLLLHALGAAVARDEDTRRARCALLPGREPAGRVRLREAAEGLVVALVPNGHEEAVHVDCPALVRVHVLDHNAGELALAQQLHHAGVHD